MNQGEDVTVIPDPAVLHITEPAETRIRGVLDEPIDGRVDFLPIKVLEASEVDQDTRAGLSLSVAVCLAQLQVPVGFSLGVLCTHSYIHQ
jgi:hypothetical protein